MRKLSFCFQSFTKVIFRWGDGGPVWPVLGVEEIRQVIFNRRVEALDVVFQMDCSDCIQSAAMYLGTGTYSSDESIEEVRKEKVP